MSSSLKADLQKNRYALYAVGVLVVLRFIVVPLMEWQDEVIESNQILQQKVTRMALLTDEQSDLDAALTTAETALNERQQWLWKANKASAFQLEQQKWLENALQERELELNNLGWAESRRVEGRSIVEHLAQITLEGRTSDFMDFMVYLQSQQQFIDVIDMQLNYRRQSIGEAGRVRARLSLVFPAQQGSNS